MENQKIKVLLAEDENDIRETIADILRDEDFEVFEARNGKIAFDIFQEKNPEVIVSDIMMPEVDGYAFLKLVRESKNKNNMVPFLFLSALGQKENVIKGMNLSASDYLVKPIDFEILIAKIREKANNYVKTHQIQERGISNIKKQISTTLSSEMDYYINKLTQGLGILKDEPYGPYPHQRYIDDITRLYQDAVRLKAAVANSLDEKVIDQRLKAEEEIFSLENFINSAVSKFPEGIKDKISFNKPYDGEENPQIKMEKGVLIAIIKKIVAGIAKFSKDYDVSISTIMDNLGQMVLIFYVTCRDGQGEIDKFIPLDKMEEIAATQSLYFKKTGDDEQFNYVLTIPSFRVV